jgi:hypothetical protein
MTKLQCGFDYTVLCSKGELSQGQVVFLLDFSQSSKLSLVLGESSSDSSGLLSSQIDRNVFLLLQLLSNLVTVSLVNDGQILGNGLSNNLSDYYRSNTLYLDLG